MSRASRWSKEQRAKLWALVRKGVAEQGTREQFTTNNGKGQDRAMTAVEFAQQLKQAMVEAGEIKQVTPVKKAAVKSEYEVTRTGRLTINDFAEITGAKSAEIFIVENPHGHSKKWRMVPVAK